MASRSATPPRPSSTRRALGWSAVAFTVAASLVGLTMAPPDALQGDAARLLYLHVPAAWTAYLAYAVVLVASVQYLRTGGLRWDRYAGPAAEIGLAMTALTIAVGSVWGRAVWGVWWAWDPRLVTTALLLVVYAAYLALRRIGDTEVIRARRAAWLGLAGSLMIPVVHFSVVWWRSLHQPATLLAPSTSPPIDPIMVTALALAMAAFTTAAAWTFLRRVAAQSAGDDHGAEPSTLIARGGSRR